MGMFDDVNFVTVCPQCGARMDGFQSKDLDCQLDRVEPDSLVNFYSSCHGCNTWVEFTRKPAAAEPREVPLTESQVLALGFTKTVDTGRMKPTSLSPSQGTEPIQP